ncbi:hypothetical protein QCA50_018692 [Cerrena zonata]|uniref:Major facilitator superfamily (MFS) profile domain-containing protein n=1 Tax=Cerrena zonata TaxID=2478898 RepID=A0AAW0FC95_9APHY
MPLVIERDREKDVGVDSEKGSMKHSSSVSTKEVSTNTKAENATSWAGTTAEKRLVRKLDMRIMPLTCIAYFFAFLDRSNPGNGRLQGLPEDVLHGDPTGKLFDLISSGFFLSYIVCQIPATVALKLFPSRIWLGCAIMGWGLASTLGAAAFNFSGLFISRIFVGIFEAGFTPAVPVYCSFWYTRYEMGRRMAFWFSFSTIGGALGGLIAFGIQNAHTTISNWRLLFIVEGIATVLIGLLTLVFLPNRPEETGFLSGEEREIQRERSSRGVKPDVGRFLVKKHALYAFKDWRVYVAGGIQLMANCSTGAIAAFLPTILKTFGVSDASAQLLTVPPYAVGAAVLIMTSHFSDHYQTRGIFVSAAATVGAIGHLLLLTVHENVHVRYFAVFCVISGTYTCIGILIAWTTNNFGSETKKATGMPIYMSIGQCGSVLGSHIFPSTEGPRYIKGFAISCALEFLAAICGIILTVSYRLDNRRKNKKYGIPNPDVEVDTDELADKAPMFRYIP